MAGSFDLTVVSPPGDGITSLRFHGEDALLASSWGRHRPRVGGGRGRGDERRDARFRTSAPVLDACFAEGGTAACSGGLAAAVSRHDLATGETAVIGAHDDAVKCVLWDEATRCVLSADGTRRSSAGISPPRRDPVRARETLPGEGLRRVPPRRRLPDDPLDPLDAAAASESRPQPRPARRRHVRAPRPGRPPPRSPRGKRLRASARVPPGTPDPMRRVPPRRIRVRPHQRGGPRRVVSVRGRRAVQLQVPPREGEGPQYQRREGGIGSFFVVRRGDDSSRGTRRRSTRGATGRRGDGLVNVGRRAAQAAAPVPGVRDGGGGAGVQRERGLRRGDELRAEQGDADALAAAIRGAASGTTR